MARRLAIPRSLAIMLVMLAGVVAFATVAMAGSPTLVGVTAPGADDTEWTTLSNGSEPDTSDGRGGLAPTPTTGLPAASPTPRPPAPAPDASGLSTRIDQGTSGRPEIALTFDAGSDRGNAEVILDTLKKYGIKASFGITGEWAEQNPDLVKRMVDEGHQLINHTWSHGSFTGASTGIDYATLDPAARADELQRTADLISQITGGYEMKPYFRPPYGDLDDSVLKDVADAGYTVTVMWSCDSMGWNGFSVEQIIHRCVDPAQSGDIILMHVGAASQDAAALPQMIEQLRAGGFSFVTIEQLVQPAL